MDEHAWVREFPGALTVCDPQGVILEMNAAAEELFAADGGPGLVGKNVFDCHPEPAGSKLKTMLAEGRTNVYTIQKNGTKKLVYQGPWKRGGANAGFVELVLVIPWEMPHFNRDAP